MERYGQDDNRRNVFREEKYMGDTNIDYDEKFGITTFQREICAELGEGFWKELTDGLTLPDIESECRCQCHNMYLFMERFGRMADKKTVEKILEMEKPDSILPNLGGQTGLNIAMELEEQGYLKENNIKQPKMAILASGYFDLTNTGESYTLNENTDPLLTKTQTSYMSTAYLIGNQVKLLPPKALSNPLISPIYADLTGLPPMYISVCEDELLYSDSLKVYNNCLRDNVKAKFHTNKNCFHAYLILGDFFLESKKATIDCCNYVKKICRLN